MLLRPKGGSGCQVEYTSLSSKPVEIPRCQVLEMPRATSPLDVVFLSGDNNLQPRPLSGTNAIETKRWFWLPSRIYLFNKFETCGNTPRLVEHKSVLCFTSSKTLSDEYALWVVFTPARCGEKVAWLGEIIL